MPATRRSKEEVKKAARQVKGRNLRDVDAGTYKISEPKTKKGGSKPKPT
jgi:hypothetical protein